MCKRTHNTLQSCQSCGNTRGGGDTYLIISEKGKVDTCHYSDGDVELSASQAIETFPLPHLDQLMMLIEQEGRGRTSST